LATRRDEFEPLCDRCGYSLEGTPDTPVCPECGLDFAASRAMRVGSPWQRRPSIIGWVATVFMMILTPRRTLCKVSFDHDRLNFPLFLCNVVAPPTLGFVVLGAVMLVEIGFWERGGEGTELLLWVFWAIGWLGCLVASYLTNLLLFACGRLVVRVARPDAPFSRRGGPAFAAHASCVLVPTVIAFALSLLSFAWVPNPAPLMVLGGGLVWFFVVCLLGTTSPGRIPPATDM
jgi:hypothetical protein